MNRRDITLQFALVSRSITTASKARFSQQIEPRQTSCRLTCLCLFGESQYLHLQPRSALTLACNRRLPFTVHTTAASIHPRLLQKARAHSHYQAVWPCSKIASPSSSTHTFALRSRIFTTQPRLCFLSRITQHSCVIVIQATKLKDGTFHHHNSLINLIPLFRNT